MVDEWNSIDFLIAGSVSKLTIVKCENEKGITEIENINLK
jgi:hypothetical protein